MNFISLLSEKIELGAIFVSNIIIYFLPFMSDVLLDKPENIMVIIGFGTRFICSPISNSMDNK